MKKEIQRKKRWRIWQDQKGQGLTEYVIILSLVAIASLVAMKGLNGTVSAIYASVVDNLKGETSTEPDFSDVPDSKEISKSRDLSNFFE